MSDLLERIVAHGNRPWYRLDASYNVVETVESLERENNITCADGFTLSVVAGGSSAYCCPKAHNDDNWTGPFDFVEVGYPSARPEPWEAWAEYCSEPDEPTQTVYGYVPVELVRALVSAHGGEA